MRATLRVTKALADMQRVRILMMLRPGELCVCQIIEVMGLAPSTVSKHLSLLSAAALVDFRKKGRWIYYRLPGKSTGISVLPVLHWLSEALKNDETINRDSVKLMAVVAADPECLCLQQRKRGGNGR